MTRFMLLSLALFFPKPVLAEEPASSSRFSLATSATYSFLPNGANASGISLSVERPLDPRSSVFLNYQTFATHGDSLASLGYKYWLAEPGRWRPWLQLAAGYLWNKSTALFPQPSHDGAEHANDFLFSFGVGVRYELAKDVGLDASAAVFKAGAPWRWSNSSKLVSSALGADVVF